MNIANREETKLRIFTRGLIYFEAVSKCFLIKFCVRILDILQLDMVLGNS